MINLKLLAMDQEFSWLEKTILLGSKLSYEEARLQ